MLTSNYAANSMFSYGTHSVADTTVTVSYSGVFYETFLLISVAFGWLVSTLTLCILHFIASVFLIIGIHKVSKRKLIVE